MVNRVINTIPQCSIATECRNNTCLLRMGQVFGYPLSPTCKADYVKIRDMERVHGEGYVPTLSFVLREGKVRVECQDFRDK